jgi:hypothetical protein
LGDSPRPFRRTSQSLGRTAQSLGNCVFALKMPVGGQNDPF